MPRSACPVCGRGGCKRHRRRDHPKAADRRAYSDTAAYRQMLTDAVETYGDSCVLCRGPIDLSLGGRNPRGLVLAHVIPHADGGPFTLDNVRPAHRDCNASAGRAPIIDA